MSEGDAHALVLHWIGSVLLMALLVLAGVLSATRRPGWEALGIITGVTYCFLGVTAMILQDAYAGSWSGGLGLIAIIAGVWYIIISLREPICSGWLREHTQSLQSQLRNLCSAARQAL